MKLFLAAIVTMPLFSLAQNVAEPHFTITGPVGGLPDNSVVCVTDVSNPTDTVARSVVKGGQFVLEGHVSEPNLYEVNFLAVNKKTPLFIGNDKMSVLRLQIFSSHEEFKTEACGNGNGEFDLSRGTLEEKP